MTKFWLSILYFSVLVVVFQATQTFFPVQKSALVTDYEYRTKHDPDGIGKFYRGREIAQVMGHLGADWLERADRLETEKPELVVKNLDLKPTDVVADIGAGTGYFTFRISPVVALGKVYAVDIQPEMLTLLEEKKRTLKIENVVPIKGGEKATNLPAQSVDVAFMVDAYHEFSYPREMMQSIIKSLRPQGRVVLIEYRAEDPAVQIKRVHKMTVAQVRKELEAVGLVWKETKNFLPYQHLIVFEKN